MKSLTKIVLVILVLIGALLHGAKAEPQSQQTVPVYATEVVPGTGTDDAQLGESLDKFFSDYKLASRDKMITIKLLINGKVVKVKELKYDEDSGSGTSMHTLDFMFIDGKLVQFGTSEHQVWVSPFGRHRPSLAEAILRAPNSRVLCYLEYDKDPGGEFIRYYYDDIKKGIAFVTDTQDASANSDAILGRNPSEPGTFYPDWVIAHRRNVPVIPIHSTDFYKPSNMEACMSMRYLLANLHPKSR